MTKDLQAAWQNAEAKAQAIMAEKDDAIDKVRAKYADKLRKATQDAADAQKVFLDADAAQHVINRDESVDTKVALLVSLGLQEAALGLGFDAYRDDGKPDPAKIAALERLVGLDDE
jgi:hypothetical protein